jgi:hypothetical protein
VFSRTCAPRIGSKAGNLRELHLCNLKAVSDKAVLGVGEQSGAVALFFLRAR